MSSLLKLIDRKNELFLEDLRKYETRLLKKISTSSFLVLGGAGSIGQAVVKEIFKREPLKLHVVDISENNMVELVRDIRSSLGYIKGDFKTYAIDVGSIEYDAFIKNDGKYDYVLNLSALKHVRSEKDEYTLMRMIDVNIFNTDKTIKLVIYFIAFYICCSRKQLFIQKNSCAYAIIKLAARKLCTSDNERWHAILLSNIFTQIFLSHYFMVCTLLLICSLVNFLMRNILPRKLRSRMFIFHIS